MLRSPAPRARSRRGVTFSSRGECFVQPAALGTSRRASYPLSARYDALAAGVPALERVCASTERGVHGCHKLWVRATLAVEPCTLDGRVAAFDRLC